jgi:hypothetical protein
MSLWDNIKNTFGYRQDPPEGDNTTTITTTDNTGSTQTKVIDKPDVVDDRTKGPYVNTSQVSDYYVYPQQSYLDSLEQQKRQRLIESIMPNVASDPNKSIPEAYYQPQTPSPIILGHTPGTPLAEFGSGMAVNIPYGLYDERQKSLLRLEQERQMRDAQRVRPLRIQGPKMAYYDTPIAAKYFTAMADQIARQYGPDFAKRAQIHGTEEYKALDNLNMTWEFEGKRSQQLGAIAEEILKDTKGIYPETLKSDLHKLQNGDPKYVFGTIERNKLNSRILAIPAYQNELTSYANTMGKDYDMSAVPKEKMDEFNELKLKGTNAEVVRYFANMTHMSEGRIKDHIDLFMRDNLPALAEAFPEYFDDNKNILPGKENELEAKVTKDYTSYFATKMPVEHGITRDQNTYVNVNTGIPTNDQRFIPNVTRTISHNWEGYKNALSNWTPIYQKDIYGKPKKDSNGLSILDEPATLASIQKSLSSTGNFRSPEGKSYGSLELSSLDSPVKMNWFNNVQPEFSDQGKNTPSTIGEYMDLIAASKDAEKNKIIAEFNAMITPRIVNGKNLNPLNKSTNIALTVKRMDGTILKDGVPVTGRDLLSYQARGINNLLDNTYPGALVTYYLDPENARNVEIFGAGKATYGSAIKKFIYNGRTVTVAQSLADEGKQEATQSLIRGQDSDYTGTAKYPGNTWPK